MKVLPSLLIALLVAAPALAAEKIYFFNWSEYLPEEVLERFTQETGIEVVYTTYESNEALYAKLKLLDGGGYDLVVPSTYYVSKMRREGLLHKIDRSLLPNFAYLDPRRLDQPFDPGNEYSVPYLWGSTGLAVHAAEFDAAQVRAWADLWKPEFKGRVMLLNDVRDVFMVGLHVLGYSGNTTNEEQIRQAHDRLRELMPSVRLFNSDSPKLPFLAGEAGVGMIWNGEAYMAAQEDSGIVYVYPREGAILWMDNLAIPQKAGHVEEAHRLIDFLLRPEIARLICEEIGYASPNRAAVELLDPELRNNRTVYPRDEDLKGAEYQVDVGEAIALYQKYWEKLKTGR